MEVAKPLARSAFSLFIALILSLGLAPPALTAAEEDSSDITSDTVWEGAVNLSQEVRVHEGATLLIQPGTTVRFSSEKDNQGKPKVRLLIQGTLVAQGTPDEPILFTSAAQQPAPGDWGGIIFERANERPNRLRHCRIEHAVEGILGGYSVILLESVELRGNRFGLVVHRGLKGGALDCDVAGNEAGIVLNQNEGFRAGLSTATSPGTRQGSSSTRTRASRSPGRASPGTGTTASCASREARPPYGTATLPTTGPGGSPATRDPRPSWKGTPYGATSAASTSSSSPGP
jgi:hypothetical protein